MLSALLVASVSVLGQSSMAAALQSRQYTSNRMLASTWRAPAPNAAMIANGASCGSKTSGLPPVRTATATMYVVPTASQSSNARAPYRLIPPATLARVQGRCLWRGGRAPIGSPNLHRFRPRYSQVLGDLTNAVRRQFGRSVAFRFKLSEA